MVNELELVGKTVNGGTPISSGGPSGGIWYLDSDSYEVYDDFTSGTISATLWTQSGTATFSTSATTNAGGVSPEAKIACAGGQDGYLLTKLLTANKHYFARIYCNSSISVGGAGGGSNAYVLIGSSYSDPVFSHSRGASSAVGCSANAVMNVLVVNTATDTYDVYVGGKKVLSDQSTATPQLRLRTRTTGTATMNMYFDDVRYSK